MATYDDLVETELKCQLSYIRKNVLLVHNTCHSDKIADKLWEVYEKLVDISEDVYDGKWKDDEEE